MTCTRTVPSLGFSELLHVDDNFLVVELPQRVFDRDSRTQFLVEEGRVALDADSDRVVSEFHFKLGQLFTRLQLGLELSAVLRE
jgi:hypothetical protein